MHATASELDIVGADPQGTVLARLHLRTGMVTPEEWDAPTSGRELSLEIMGNAYPPFASAGLAPLMLPLTGDPYLNTFVLDPFVAQILSRSGITFADRVLADEPEVGYAQCSMTTNTDTFFTPCNGYGARSSCIDFWGSWNGAALWAQKVVCDDPTQTRAERLCGSAGVATPCGTTGPNGCATCGPAGNGGSTECSNDSCVFRSASGGGGGGSCSGTACSDACSTDAECCNCGGYCGSDGLCVY